jgi:cell division septum initiation protein DivIVA
MAGIDIDRQMFVQPPKKSPDLPFRILGVVALIAVAVALALAGYKLASSFSLFGPTVQAHDTDQVQQQLDDIEKRLDNLEKHRRTTAIASAAVPARTDAVNSGATGGAPARPRPAYTISSASAMKPQSNSASRPAAMQASSAPATSTATAVASPAANAPDEAAIANREAWEATTDRLADVVGVVGSQQGEITQTRDQVNQLLAQTRRTATQFELRRGTDPQPVGPVSLLLKDADLKKQRYTLCVYVSSQCIELKDRAVDEVVVFAVSHDRTPLELIATKVTRDGIVGYLEVPTNK